MFIEKPNAILYLRATSLECLGDGLQSDNVVFPKEVVSNGQVLDKDKFRQLLIEFFAKASVEKKSLVLVLGEDMLFQKTVPFDDHDKVVLAADLFFEQVPLGPQSLAKKTLTNDKEVFLLAANKDLYEPVIDVAESMGWYIVYVVPFPLVRQKEGELKKEDVAEIVSKARVLQVTDFFPDNPIEHRKKRLGINPKYLFFAFLMLFIIEFVFGVFLFLNREKARNQEDAHITPTVSMLSPTQAPTISKTALKAQILNGTGIPGQALKVKDQLEDLGYKDIITGNAKPTSKGETTVQFSSKIPQKLQDELVLRLQEIFASVSTEDTTSTSYDIIVTTGKER